MKKKIFITIVMSALMLSFESCANSTTNSAAGHSAQVLSSSSSTSVQSSSSNSIQYGTLVDLRDSQTYKTVVIGTQTWMAQNLDYTMGASSCYDDSVKNCQTYGRLYSWISADSACPQGWHLPSDSEWVVMEEFLGMDSNATQHTGGRGTTQGTMLKSDTSLWIINAGNNATGFSAIPSGIYGETQYSILGDIAYFWTSTPVDSTDAFFRALIGSYPTITKILFPMSYRMSVRCIKG